MTKHIVQNLEF